MADEQEKPMCKYGFNCYQRNDVHKKRFNHPTKPDVNKPQTPKRDPSSSPDSKPNEKKIKLSPRNNNDDTSETDPDDEEVNSDNSSNDTSDEEAIDVKSSLSHDIDAVKLSPKKEDVASPSKLKESQIVPGSPAEFIKLNFLVEMPADFYKFWEFCKTESKSKISPEMLFNKFGLRLVGPFDVLAKKFDTDSQFNKNEYLRHWRFFYDPPEFQTVIVKEKTGIHYGYWRDEPTGRCFIARNNVEENCEFTIIADNLFAGLLYILDKDIQLSPFNRAMGLAMKKSLEQYANKENIPLTTLSAKLKGRNSKSVCKTFHRAGLVVPYDRKTDVGYRQLAESDANLKKMLKKFNDANGDANLIRAAMDHLQPLITAANIACDEGDFGNTIELGIDLFCFGARELHPVALQLLKTGYSMINRPQFVDIVEAHLEDRKRGWSNLSILEQSSISKK